MPERNPDQFTAAIIGAGSVGEYHINAQRVLGSEIVIYEPSAARTEEVLQKYGALIVARTLEEAIEQADVVHICTPHNRHAEGALASIVHGKPTIIEKPLTVNLDESVDIYRATQATGTPVVVGTSFRLTPPFMEISDGLRKGEVGELISLHTTYLHNMARAKINNGGGWRQGSDRGSFLYGGGSHAIDLNMWLANQPVKTVQAKIGGKKVRHEYPGDEDFDLSLGYEDGTTGRVWVSAAASLPVHGADVEVYGTRGTYRANNKSPILLTYKEGDEGWSHREVGLTHTIDTMSAIFNKYIRGERPDFAPLPGIAEGLGVMIATRTLELAAQSGETELVPTLEEIVAG